MPKKRWSHTSSGKAHTSSNRASGDKPNQRRYQLRLVTYNPPRCSGASLVKSAFHRCARHAGLVALSAAIVLGLAGCGAGSGPAPPVVRVGTGTPLQTFDPHMADSGPAFSNYLTLVYDGLTRTYSDNFNTPRPNLATDWEWTTPTTIVMNLRRDVRFTDGTPFDAKAAQANLDRMLESRGPRYNTVSSVSHTDVLGPYRIRINLRFADPTILQNLAGSPGMMVSPAAFDNPDLDINPVGSGPWIYDKERSVIGDVHRFSVNPSYHGEDPAELAPFELHVLTDVKARLNALISGQVDMCVVGPSEAAPAKNMGYAIAQRANRWFGMTLLDRRGELVPEFADVRVRRALGYAVDKALVAEVVFFGFARPASQPMSSEEIGHDVLLRDHYTYNPEKARALLDEAGVERFSFEVPVAPSVSAQYEAVQAYLKKVGIDMVIKVIEPGTTGPLARTLQYPVNTIGYPNFDPDNRHLAIWDSKAAFNPFRIDSPVTDALAEEARASLDDDLRRRNYEKYFNVVVKDVYSLVYLQVDDLIAYDAERLQDVRVSRYIDPMLRELRLRPKHRAAPDA